MAVVWKKIAYSGDAPTAHKASHQDTGGDELDVVGLSGLLADDQHVLDSEVTAVAVARSILDAHSVLMAVSDNTPVALAVAASRILGREATGNIAAMTVAELLTLIGVEAGAKDDLTGVEIVALLEALAGAAQLSHTKISDVGATDHHTAAILASLLTTKGDVIARSTVPVRIPVGANDEVLTADSAQASGLKWAAAGNGGIWTLAETLSPSAVTSINSSVFSPHDLWMVILDIMAYAASRTEEQIEMRFNDDTGSVYGTRYIDDTSITTSSGQDRIKIGSIYSFNDARSWSAIGQLMMTGKRKTTNQDSIGITGMFGGSGSQATGYNRILNAYWYSQAQDITKMNFLFGAAVTGKIQIYYKDY